MTNLTARDIWAQYRGCENALRSYGDAFAHFMLRSGEAGLDASISLDRATEDPLIQVFPDRCRPPFCKKAFSVVVDDMRQIAAKINALVDATAAFAALPENRREDSGHYVSEVPGTSWTG